MGVPPLRALVRRDDERPGGAARAARRGDCPFPNSTAVTELTSDDGLTRKRLLRLHDGKLIESVLMLYDPRSDSRGRATVCVSSQAGCAMGCVFCATGQAGFERNLTTGEIVAQVIAFARDQRDGGGAADHQRRVHGHGRADGELRAVWRAVETLHEPEGFGIGRAPHHDLDRRADAGHPQARRGVAAGRPRRLAARAGRRAAPDA